MQVGARVTIFTSQKPSVTIQYSKSTEIVSRSTLFHGVGGTSTANHSCESSSPSPIHFPSMEVYHWVYCCSLTARQWTAFLRGFIKREAAQEKAPPWLPPNGITCLGRRKKWSTVPLTPSPYRQSRWYHGQWGWKRPEGVHSFHPGLSFVVKHTMFLRPNSSHTPFLP